MRRPAVRYLPAWRDAVWNANRKPLAVEFFNDADCVSTVRCGKAGPDLSGEPIPYLLIAQLYRAQYVVSIYGVDGGSKIPAIDLRLWRWGWDSNPRCTCAHNGFRDRPVRPLRHPTPAHGRSPCIRSCLHRQGVCQVRYLRRPRGWTSSRAVCSRGAGWHGAEHVRSAVSGSPRVFTSRFRFSAAVRSAPA